MLNNKFFIFSLVLILTTCLFSCNYYSENDATRYLPGKYSYEFPSGETSILIVNPDFTFNNKIYTKNKKAMLYETNGTMKVDGRHISFENFLLFGEHTESEMVFSKPDIGGTLNNYWEKPRDNEGVLIDMFSPYNYIFQKIE